MRKFCNEGRRCLVGGGIKTKILNFRKFPCSVCLHLSSLVFPLVSLSSRHKSQQSIGSLQKVPQRCQIPQHPLHICQGGCSGGGLPHTHHLCALLVALMDFETQMATGEATVRSGSCCYTPQCLEASFLFPRKALEPIPAFLYTHTLSKLWLLVQECTCEEVF